MAWFGEITSMQRENDSWKMVVEYYDDQMADKRIPRSFTFPLIITRPDVISAIKARGVEIMRAVTLNTQNVVGTIVPIP